MSASARSHRRHRAAFGVVAGVVALLAAIVGLGAVEPDLLDTSGHHA